VCACVSGRGPAAASLAIEDNVGFSDGTELCEHLWNETHVYQYVYASQLSKTVPVICEHNGVLLQLFFWGERGLFQCLQ